MMQTQNERLNSPCINEEVGAGPAEEKCCLFMLLFQAVDSSFLDLLSIPDNKNKADLNNLTRDSVL